MSLKRYQNKRDFTKTSEPQGNLRIKDKHLFVIQKHAASHLHYDFRLELNGVLKSWAIPKGPCLDPKVKRLAVHVEDHPIEYGDFEGIIPKGEYGGGTVMLWDQGRWFPLDEDPFEAYNKGHLRLELRARKLKGRWDLIRFQGEENWFLIKYNDSYAKTLSKYDITKALPNSTLSHLSMEELSKGYQKIWTNQGAKKANIKLPSDLPKEVFPDFIYPQLATLVDKAPEGKGWIHEVKWDGYRILAFINKGQIILKSRNNKDWTSYFPRIVKALQKLQLEQAVLDGEIVVLDKQGRSNFQLLQNSIKSKSQANLIYCIFDLLHYNGYDLKNLALDQRKKYLSTLLTKLKLPELHYSDHVLGEGAQVFQQACKIHLEGIVSKDSGAFYSTNRSKSWLKTKCLHRQEFVIGGYTRPKKTRSYFGSLLLGVFNSKGQFEYTGNVGTGFTKHSLKEIYEKLHLKEQDKNPFNSRPPYASQATWVKPLVIAEVEFSEWTQDKRIRHPSFKGLRVDKKAKEVRRETPKTLEKIPRSSFKITNPDKILYPEDGITKADLLNYYEMISDFMLPFLRNRPLTFLRCPENYQHCFYQRHFNHNLPKNLKTIKTNNEEYVYLTNKKGLLQLAQLGILEIHPWGSQIRNLDKPDRIVFDLDPGEGVSWKNIVKAAFEVRRYLEEYGLISFVRTTGGKGLHIVVPIKPTKDWKSVKEFSHTFVELLEQINPKNYLSNMAKFKRKGKLFIDYLRNQKTATAIASYSPRARVHAPVSTPIYWDELTSNKRDTEFTIRTMEKRLLGLKEDPWEEFWGIKQILDLNQ